MLQNKIAEDIDPVELFNVPAVFAGYDALNIAMRQVARWLNYNSGQVARWRISRREIPPHILLVLCWILRKVINDYVAVHANPSAEIRITRSYTYDLLFLRIIFADKCLKREIEEFVRETGPEEIRKAVRDANIHILYETGDDQTKRKSIEQPIIFNTFGNIDFGVDLLNDKKALDVWINFVQACKKANENHAEARAFFEDPKTAESIYKHYNQQYLKLLESEKNEDSKEDSKDGTDIEE